MVQYAKSASISEQMYQDAGSSITRCTSIRIELLLQIKKIFMTTVVFRENNVVHRFLLQTIKVDS